MKTCFQLCDDVITGVDSVLQALSLFAEHEHLIGELDNLGPHLVQRTHESDALRLQLLLRLLRIVGPRLGNLELSLGLLELTGVCR